MGFFFVVFVLIIRMRMFGFILGFCFDTNSEILSKESNVSDPATHVSGVSAFAAVAAGAVFVLV